MGVDWRGQIVYCHTRWRLLQEQGDPFFDWYIRSRASQCPSAILLWSSSYFLKQNGIFVFSQLLADDFAANGFKVRCFETVTYAQTFIVTFRLIFRLLSLITSLVILSLQPLLVLETPWISISRVGSRTILRKRPVPSSIKCWKLLRMKE